MVKNIKKTYLGITLLITRNYLLKHYGALWCTTYLCSHFRTVGLFIGTNYIPYETNL